MNLKNAIRATLAYHDIFDYPLKAEEIHKYLIEKSASIKQIEVQLQKLTTEKKILKIANFYCLKGRGGIIKTRKLRRSYSKQKLKRARLYGRILKFMPTVEAVAVSGALSMENSTKNDDIDYAILTKKGQMWTTRLGANVLLLPFKRTPGSKVQKDRVCLNLFLAQNSLKIRTQNLYIAHEITQLKPLWQRNNAYFSFVKANPWVQNYLPNWKVDFAGSKPKLKGESKKQNTIISHALSLLEFFSKKFQLAYMHSKITTEQIGENQLFFHPSGTQNWVLEQYQKRLKKLGV